MLAAAARAELAAGRCGRAWRHFDDARELWRGSPLSDLGCTSTMYGHVARLEEEHLALMQDRATALFGCGAGAQAVPELEDLCSRQPLHHHLLVTLYQADRRADALAAYARACRLLAAEAGIEPGPRLRAAHQAVLQQRDPPPAASAGTANSRRGTAKSGARQVGGS